MKTLLLSFLLCASAQAQEAIKFMIEAPPVFNTLEEAAIAGLKSIADKPTGAYYEWGGELIRTSTGKYMALPANTGFAGDHVNIGDSKYERLGRKVGSYHNHPCLSHHYVEYFSTDDMEEPIYYRRIAFMGDFCTGNVHEFKPGDKPGAEAVGYDRGEGLHLSKGRIIGVFTTPHAELVDE